MLKSRVSSYAFSTLEYTEVQDGLFRHVNFTAVLAVIGLIPFCKTLAELLG